jgi:hypothetical protein
VGAAQLSFIVPPVFTDEEMAKAVFGISNFGHRSVAVLIWLKTWRVPSSELLIHYLTASV